MSVRNSSVAVNALQVSRKAHNAIVGYLCHELRNPLHVLETWFKTIIDSAALHASSTGSTDMNGMDGDDIVVITADVEAALSQMRSTVDDVLDFRQVASVPLLVALSSFYVNVYLMLLGPVNNIACVCMYACMLVICVHVRMYARSLPVQHALESE